MITKVIDRDNSKHGELHSPAIRFQSIQVTDGSFLRAPRQLCSIRWRREVRLWHRRPLEGIETEGFDANRISAATRRGWNSTHVWSSCIGFGGRGDKNI